VLWRALTHACRPPHPACACVDGSNERRDEGRNAIEGGAARMAQLLEEHNAENFSPAPASSP
jgi:hypothetical protein